MKTMIIAILKNGSRAVREVAVPPHAWDATMKQVGKTLNGHVVIKAVVIDGVDVYEYNSNEVAEIFGLEG